MDDSNIISNISPLLTPGVIMTIGSIIVWLCKRFLERLEEQFRNIEAQFKGIADALKIHERRITRAETNIERILHPHGQHLPNMHIPPDGLEKRSHARI